MNTIDLEKTALTIPELARLAKSGTVIISCNGKPLAAVKDLSGSDWESVSLANNTRFLALIEESRRSYREQGGISLDAIRQELDLPASRRRAPKKQKRQKK